MVIVTYKRERALLAAIERLKGLPYLHKVLVIWNDPDPPSPTLAWPTIGVTVVVVRGKGNSMNNRYLPFDVIETDCIFNLDDDVQISHTFVINGFRLWRNERDHLVGYRSRWHVWDVKKGLWQYRLGKHPETSIVIPSVSFIHKMYLYLYTYSMPQAIRDRVDQTMNCEDIAMAFLIAHVSRKPPVKVSSDLRSSCPGCRGGISTTAGHMQKRHDCLNFFAQVYGYMPLLFSPI